MSETTRSMSRDELEAELEDNGLQVLEGDTTEDLREFVEEVRGS